ncbi:FliC/FljB family flagellin [Achromobacter dolens]|uniref:FliC/FljB family flagellin n=1 Tax=Achromobacter dolens TaxID=1287738 RepID=UPI0006C2E779|nr:FliC/FljB family flagellin [Achromobacter dolens]CUJ75603.1 Phase 1-I flagellin [Achromobacter dolens]
MAAVINTNYLSLVAQNNLNKSQSALGTAIERLSSGLRINSAKDDAAGMAIANRFTANVKGLTQAARNANDGISLAQTTEGAASEVNTHLQRIRELTVQASNGSYSQEQLNSMQDEINQRMSDIDRISQQTDFNGVKVLSASAKPLTLQVGANDGETITLNLSEISVKTLGLDGFNVNGSGVTQNRSATINDITSAGGTLVPGETTKYEITTKFDVATTANAFDQLQTGNKVVIGPSASAETYTYDAATKSFTHNTTDSAANVASANTPGAGKTLNGTYTSSTGTVDFQVNSDGDVTIGGAAAYLTSDGNLTTNNSNGTGGTLTQAKLNDLTTAVVAHKADDSGYKNAGATLKLGNTVYSQEAFTAGAANNLAYTETVAKDVVLAKTTVAATNTRITLGSGLLSATVGFTAGESATLAADATLAATTKTYVDGKGEFTQVAQFITNYSLNQADGTITVADGGTSTSTGYEPAVGSKVYVGSDGKLTSETSSKGSKTTDPLKALDSAFTKLDKLTGELGAVQNRLESTIANLNNVVNNLSSARSRIQDADYATEVSNMSKAQILQQAGTSVLAQANQVPQTVLSLLR